MLGFPTPYFEELLYSTIARAGVHEGETSPKQLLDKVYNNRGVIATVDLPSHVGKIASHYCISLGLDSKTLIERHTLWPIYAPFLPPERNNKLKEWMNGSSQGAAHLASGVAASRVKAKTKLYVCVRCLREQNSQFGECFFNRLWQVPLLRVCPTHGSLHTTSIDLDGEHRHSFIPVEAAEILTPLKTEAVDTIYSHQITQLFKVRNNGINSYQWTVFYKYLASSFGFLCGKKIDHSKIRDSVIQFWGKRWLSDTGIFPSNRETSWLRGLFRKHRKSFSFAEHIIAILALSNGRVSIYDAINKASTMAIRDKVQNNRNDHNLNDETQLSQDQSKWVYLLKQNNPKAARRKNPALYARLYRRHYNWLMQINKLHRADPVTINKRVNWSQRDRKCARELRRVCENLSEDLNAPHLSKTFLIHQIKHRAMVEKNIHRLPRCSSILSIYSESIDEYQARRLTRTYFSMVKKCQQIKRWSLLRQAGLSDERMTDNVARLLKEILKGNGQS